MYQLYVLDPEASLLPDTLFGDLEVHRYEDPTHFPITEISQNQAICLLNMELGGLDIAISLHSPVTILTGNRLLDALNAYQAEHCFFLYRPELEKQLGQALQKAIMRLDAMKTRVPILRKDKTILLSLSQITYFERDKRITHVHTDAGKLDTYQKFADLSPFLSSHFVQCHHSFIVNTQYISWLERTQIVLKTGDILPVSRAYAHETRRKILKRIPS